MKLTKPTNKTGKDFTIFLKPKAVMKMKREEKAEKETCLPMPKKGAYKGDKLA